MSDFLKRYSRLSEEKHSILCVGLDPALPWQRSKNVIPSKYVEGADENEARLNFCLDIIDQTNEDAVAAKPNEQYVRGFTKQQHQRLTTYIRKKGFISIYDCKLNDISDTLESAICWMHEYGYDAITFNPLPGNLKEVVKLAHKYDKPIGILVLTLMSNPEAVKYLKEAKIGGKPVYLEIAEDVRKYGADGCVVGATGHVTEEDIKSIRVAVGEDKVLLIPGIGAQRGDPEKAIRAGGRNILINVGRDIIYSDDPKKKAEEYKKRFNEIRSMYEI